MPAVPALAVGICTLSIVLSATLLIGGDAKLPWVPRCIGALENARLSYAENHADTPPLTWKLHRTKWTVPHICGAQPLTVLDFQVGRFGGQFYTSGGPDPDPDRDWSDWDELGKHRAGRNASLHLDESDHSPDSIELARAFQTALDECIDAAPVMPYAPIPLTDGDLRAICVVEMPGAPPEPCLDAMHAYVLLDEACRIETSHIGITGSAGHTNPELLRVLALGDLSLPILYRLSRSPNANARAAAAIGLGNLGGADSQPTLQRLLADHAEARYIAGCVEDGFPVSRIAQWAAAGDYQLRR